MSGLAPDNAPTILDYLNEDCWRAILDYVPTQDIIRTEGTSRRWQLAVLAYLRGVRIGVKDSGCRNIRSERRHIRLLTLGQLDGDLASFERWASKLGPSVVLARCSHSGILTLIRRHCPNLDDLTLQYVENPWDFENENGSFMSGCLRRFCFEGYHHDDSFEYCVHISSFASVTVEELHIKKSLLVTDQCFSNTQWTKLTSLKLDYCDLKYCDLLAATCLAQLTSFQLRYARIGYQNLIYQNIPHLLLDKMPRLERLCVISFNRGLNSRRFFESVSRLSRLRVLVANLMATDEDLEAVARRCEELTVLQLTGHFNGEGISGAGVAALCRAAGARLTRLALPAARLTGDDVVAVAAACPRLQLDVHGLGLSGAILSRAAAARRGLRARTPLHLAGDFALTTDSGYDELVYHRGWKSKNACAKCR